MKELSVSITNMNIELLQRLIFLSLIKSVHEETKYNCDQCEYTDTHKGNFAHHIQSIHEGSKYKYSQGATGKTYKTRWTDSLIELHCHDY